MSESPKILGILNVTRDSFSDGGAYLDSDLAIRRADELASDGADVIDIGAAASNPDAESVPFEVEVARLDPVVSHLQARGVRVSIDSFSTETQRWALSRSVDFLNDIQGFSDPSFYPELADARCKLIVMHSVQASGAATRVASDADTIRDRILEFFETRLRSLRDAGVSNSRLILDPGMGFFLGDSPEVSMTVLQWLPDLRKHFELPVLISVSRKSFLGALTGAPVDARGSATLTTELKAAEQGVDYIRTHDVRSLTGALSAG